MEFGREPWVTVEEVAEHIGVCKMTVYRFMAQDPPLPSHKLGRLRKFRLSEVDAWVGSQSRCISTPPDQTAAVAS